MRTTLTIDDDVLAAARGMASRRKSSVGEATSSLARQALAPQVSKDRRRNGILLLPFREDGGAVTLELVNRLRDELP